MVKPLEDILTPERLEKGDRIRLTKGEDQKVDWEGDPTSFEITVLFTRMTFAFGWEVVSEEPISAEGIQYFYPRDGWQLSLVKDVRDKPYERPETEEEKHGRG